MASAGRNVGVFLVLGVLVSLATVGCTQGGAAYKTAPVKGKVIYNGQPVTSGGIHLQPITVQGAAESNPGKPANGQV